MPECLTPETAPAHGPVPKDHWYVTVFCEHGFRRTVEVTPVWLFLPLQDDCPQANQERRAECDHEHGMCYGAYFAPFEGDDA